MQLYFRLAWRNIWRHRRRTIIIVLAMSMTLALMMFYDGLMSGFTDTIYGIPELAGHCLDSPGGCDEFVHKQRGDQIIS